MAKSVEIIYFQLGDLLLEQFKIAAKSIRKYAPDVKIILYSEYLEKDLPKGLEYDVYRIWNTDIKESGDIGTLAFGEITSNKSLIILDALVNCRSDILVYSDVDIVALKSFSHILSVFVSKGDFWIAQEGTVLNDVIYNYCTGFIIMNGSQKNKEILIEWNEEQKRLMQLDASLHDQDAFNHLMQKQQNSRYVHGLPLAMVAPGWMYELYSPWHKSKIIPYFFHANWTIGKNKKIERMLDIVFTNSIQNRRFLVLKISKISNFLVRLILKFLQINVKDY